MMAVADDVKKRFAEYVKVQALGGRFIDRATERKILEDGVMRFEISLDEGRQIMLGVAADEGYGFESEADQRIKDILDGFAEDRKIDKREFSNAVVFYRKFCNNGVSEDDARRRIKKIMIAEGLKPKGFTLLGGKRWYNKVDADKA
jgi:hypothetical protein